MPIYKTGKTGVMSGGTTKKAPAKPPKSAPSIGRKGSTGFTDFTTGVGSGKAPPNMKRAAPKNPNPDMPKQSGAGKRTASPPRTGRK